MTPPRGLAMRHSGGGFVPWTDALQSVPTEQRWVFQRMSWSWTSPAMSFVLAPHGKVAAVVENRSKVRYQPFDPADPAHLPAGPRFDTTRYRAALLQQQGAPSQK
jgi:hypothetical protein